jgi:transcriptional regulator with XRE-family HTH domain
MPTPRIKLANRRKALGYSQETLAHALDLRLTTVARWEQGVTMPLARHRQPLAKLLQVSPAELEFLLLSDNPQDALALNGHQLEAVPEWLTLYAKLEFTAVRARVAELTAVPALLQTRAYAAAVERLHHLPVSDGEAQRRVHARISRQSVLDRTDSPLEPLELLVVTTEAAIRETVGDEEVMAEQCDHLVAMTGRSNIDLRVLPADGRALCAVESFQLLTSPGSPDPFIVCTDGQMGFRYDESPMAIQQFLDLFNYLAAVALSPTNSVDLIQTIKKEKYQP